MKLIYNNIIMRNLKFVAAFVFMILAAVSCSGRDDEGTIPPPPDSEKRMEWELVFEDDFDGDCVDETVWSVYDYPGHAGNGLRSPEALSVEKGLFIITASMKDGVLYSGAMAHKQNYTYGKFEFRVRCEPDPSGAMSAVVLTWPQDEAWPDSGENDIYETHSEQNKDRKFLTTNILSGLPLNKWSNKKYDDVDATEWHVVAMEWQDNMMRFYIDGRLRWRLDNPKDFTHKPHHLCIQYDAFKPEMTGVTRMFVDWVKIYQAKNRDE